VRRAIGNRPAALKLSSMLGTTQAECGRYILLVNDIEAV